ncbi:uncharacterized protein LOC142358282 [Convolutriloba macropyga]|uniref:uncharacterized protein LOC142358282 n=1 Tax=Convolutriloba macropyga TaxID=536237 RepID=UPI003F51DD75
MVLWHVVSSLSAPGGIWDWLALRREALEEWMEATQGKGQFPAPSDLTFLLLFLLQTTHSVWQEYRAPEGRITLFLGNKTQAQLDSLQLHVAPSTAFRAQITTPVPPCLPAKTQQQVVIMVGASGPALDPPTLSLRYQLGAAQVNQSLPLPSVNCKFLTPIQGLASADFFAAWQAIAGPPLKLQEVVARPHPMPPSQVAAFLPNLNFGVLPGLDPNQNNVVAAATFAVPGGFNPLCMCRIEVEPNSKQQLRVTVATGDPTLSSTLKELIKQQILAV